MSNPGSQLSTPNDAVAEVREELAVSAEKAGRDTEAAGQAWARAYDVFELQIEPVIRRRCGRRTATEIEYTFGAVRAAIDSRGDTVATIDTLQRSIDDCMLLVNAPPGR